MAKKRITRKLVAETLAQQSAGYTRQIDTFNAAADRHERQENFKAAAEYRTLAREAVMMRSALASVTLALGLSDEVAVRRCQIGQQKRAISA